MIMSHPNRPLVLFLAPAFPQRSLREPRSRPSPCVPDAKPLSSGDLVVAFRQWLMDHSRWISDEQDLSHEAFERTLTLERVLREEFYALSGRPRPRVHHRPATAA